MPLSRHLPRAATANSPFLPLAFRFAAAFGLAALHLALPLPESGRILQGESIYLLALLILFLESLWEVSRSLSATGQLFSIPTRGWVRWNLLLDALLVTLVIAFHGVDQERLATIYIFPVLASAFYMSIAEIVGTGLISVGFHIASVMLFTTGILPAFGHSGPNPDMDLSQRNYILGFATFQILAATLVVVLIRKHLETLRTTLTRSEAAVDELATFHERVVESMFSGLITTDLEGRITSANPAARTIFQRELRNGETMPELEELDVSSFETYPREHRFELDYAATDGSRRIVGGNVAPLRGPGGVQTGHLLLIQDLTELKALEERSRISERLAAAGELSSEMAHELRNPMASILGCVQLLRQAEQSEATVSRALTILGRESERVSEIVSHFLEFARPRPMRMESLPLPRLAEELRASWETDARNRGIALAMDPVPTVHVRADALCFHQVFTNLLSNARKALQQTAAPRLKLSFVRKGDSVEARLSDNGCGMDAERLRTVFLPFSSGFAEGTGLGMSLVYQFTQRMGWTITLQSSPGAGTQATLTLPLAAPPAGDEAPDQP